MEAASSSQERLKLLRAEPPLQGLGSRQALGPVVSAMLVELVQPISPAELMGSVTFPGRYQRGKAQGDAGRGAMLFAIQTTCGCFSATSAASWVPPSHLGSPEETVMPSARP